MVVVCLALLAARLHEHADAGGLAVFVVVFAALWSTWTSFVVYADIAGEGTRVAVLLAGAGLIGLMTTALGDLDDRGATFAVGVVLCRVIASRASQRTGRLLTSWPAVQLGGLSGLWIASIWVPPPARYWVWGVAVALELVLAVGRAAEDEGDAQALVARVNARLQGRGRPDRRTPPQVVATREDEAHVAERLGLFMIIVLGEGVTEVVQAGSEVPVSVTARLGEGAAFLLLAALWWLIFHHRAGPGVQGAPLRVALPLHLLATGALVLVAAALGRLVLDIGDGAEPFWRWCAAGGIAAWFGIVALLAALAGVARAWVGGRALASAVAALLVGALAGGAEAQWVIVLLLAAVAWTALAPRATARSGSPAS